MDQANPNKCVLVLDNNKFREQLMRGSISSHGIELLSIPDRDQALEMLSSEKPGALVCDLETAGMDLLRTVRQRFPDLAIIVITGFADDRHSVVTQLEGIATTLLTQPLVQEEIIVAIRDVILRETLSSAADALNMQQHKRRSRVLVVDDDLLLLRSIRRGLDAHGYDVTCIFNGALAIEAVEASDFDILRTDIKMSGMDGITLTRKIKELKPGLPILVFSGMKDVAISQQALRAGAYCYVTKPLELQELSAFMDRAILAGRLESELREQNALLEKRTEQLRRSLKLLSEQAEHQEIGRTATVKKLSEDLAHELKNPLNGIQASFDYVRSRIPQETLAAEPKLAKHCELVDAHIGRTKDLIESILDSAETLDLMAMENASSG